MVAEPPPLTEGIEAAGRRFGVDHLEMAVRHAALIKLAVERGFAAPSALRRILTPHGFAQQRDPGISRFTGPPPVPSHLGGTQLSVTSPTRALAAVAAKETAQRWGALVVDLRATGQGRLVVAELLRVQDRALVRGAAAPPPDKMPARTDRLQRQVRSLLSERDLVRRTQSDAMLRGTPAAAWSLRLVAVDHELAALTARLDPAAAPGGSTEPLLGAEPPDSDHDAWNQWRAAYLELLDFRDGPPPSPDTPPAPYLHAPTVQLGLGL